MLEGVWVWVRGRAEAGRDYTRRQFNNFPLLILFLSLPRLSLTHQPSLVPFTCPLTLHPPNPLLCFPLLPPYPFHLSPLLFPFLLTFPSLPTLNCVLSTHSPRSFFAHSFSLPSIFPSITQSLYISLTLPISSTHPIFPLFSLHLTTPALNSFSRS